MVVGATMLSTRSIMYVSYPTKVIFKSAKLIPTMVVATIVNPGASSYGFLDYLAAAMLCCGAAGYAYGAGGSGRGGDADSSGQTFGVVLLLMSMVCDAFVPNLQQRLMAPPTAAVAPDGGDGGGGGGGGGGATSGLGLSASQLMVNVNGVGFAGLLAYMVVSGSLFSAVATALASPSLLGYLLTIGCGLGTAVLAYTKLIKASGSVVAVAVSTLRKVATVVLSYVVFPKPILRIHIASGFVVLCGILLSAYSKQVADRAKRASNGSSHGGGGGGGVDGSGGGKGGGGGGGGH